MSKWCPNCGIEIDHLDFESNVTQYGTETGTMDVNTGDYDSDNTDWGDEESDSTTHRCPECGDEVRVDDLLDEDPESEDEDIEVHDIEVHYPEASMTEGNSNIVHARNNIIADRDNPSLRNIACPNCHVLNFVDSTNDSIICIACNHEIIN